MEIKKSVVFNKIIVNSELTPEKVCSELNHNLYTDKTGVGILNVSMDEGIVHVEILMKIPTYINNYDQQEKTFNKTIVDIFEDVVVDMDFKNCLLYSSSASSRLTKAKVFIRNIFGGKLSFDNIQLPYMKVLDWMETEQFQYDILSMTIRKFKYDENAIGRFSAKISSRETGLRLMNDYKDDVINVLLRVEPDRLSPFVMQSAMQNTIALKCEESDFWSIIEIIKRNL